MAQMNRDGRLNSQQERFCQEYLLDDNGTRAAIRAGYSEKSAGQQACALLKKPNIISRVKELRQERAEALGLDANWVLLKLVEVARKSLQEVEVEKWDYEEKCMMGIGEYVFDSKGANGALQMIGKHLGMFTEKVQVSGEVQIDDARSRLVEKLLKDSGS